MARGSIVICDPEQVETFAVQLAHFNRNLTESVQQIRGVIAGAQNAWRDRQYEQFTAEFQRNMAAVERFLQDSERQVPYLRRKAGIIRRYLAHR